MSRFTERARRWLGAHPKARQWLWFAALWASGLAAVTALSYPIKWLMTGL